MSGSISFNGMPGSIRVPGSYIEIDNSRALRGLTDWPARVAILGQRLAAGTVVAATPTRVTSADQARTFFGRGSLLAHMFEAWFRAGNPATEVWGVAMDDVGGGAQATGTITCSGTASAAGVIALMIGGRRVEVSIPSGTVATAVATAINAAVNANLDLPVTSSVTGGQVTFTARHRGETGNAIDIRHSYNAGEALPPGVVLIFAAMSGGTQNPVVTTALDALGETWFTDIVTPWTDATNIGLVEARMATNFGPLVMRDGHAWAARSDTFANLITFGTSRNSPQMSVMGVRGSPTPPWEWASTLAGVAIPALAADPARPVQTLQLPGMLAPTIANRFTWTERDQLLRNGIATWRANDAGQVFIERVVTTYTTSPAGSADISFLDVETLKTVAYLRYDLRTMIALRFPRHKLADDGTNFARGQAVVTPGTIRAEIIARFKQWEAAGLVEGVDQFKADLIVTRNGSDPNRVDALLPPDLVNQFRVLAAQIEFLL
jgi:phage tail sheath gpL-like